MGTEETEESGFGEVQGLEEVREDLEARDHLRRRAGTGQDSSAATVPAGRRRRCPCSGAWSW